MASCLNHSIQHGTDIWSRPERLDIAARAIVSKVLVLSGGHKDTAPQSDLIGWTDPRQKESYHAFREIPACIVPGDICVAQSSEIGSNSVAIAAIA